jgi:hypothetical protein
MNGIPSTRPPAIAASIITGGNAARSPPLTPEHRRSRRSVMKRFIAPAFCWKATSTGDGARMCGGPKYLLDNNITNTIHIIHAIHRACDKQQQNNSIYLVFKSN